MKPLSILIALFHLSFGLCLNSLSASVAVDDITSEEYAVYSAAIRSMYVKEAVKTVVVDQQTQFYKVNWERSEDYLKSILNELRPLSRETIEDFEERNEKQGKLARHLNLAVDYVLLGKQSVPRTPEEYAKNWKVFYEKYPTSPGIISLSRVGFNSTRDEALVYVADVCGGLCGKGYYVLLTKSGEGWKFQKEMMLWVS